jgi:hypothetical protein
MESEIPKELYSRNSTGCKPTLFISPSGSQSDYRAAARPTISAPERRYLEKRATRLSDDSR